MGLSTVYLGGGGTLSGSSSCWYTGGSGSSGIYCNNHLSIHFSLIHTLSLNWPPEAVVRNLPLLRTLQANKVLSCTATDFTHTVLSYNFTKKCYLLSAVTSLATHFSKSCASNVIYILAGSEREFKMSLWVDKHRPTSLSKLDYHKDQAKWLGRLVSAVWIQPAAETLGSCRSKLGTCHTCWFMGHLEQGRKLASCVSWGSCMGVVQRNWGWNTWPSLYVCMQLNPNVDHNDLYSCI